MSVGNAKRTEVTVMVSTSPESGVEGMREDEESRSSSVVDQELRVHCKALREMSARPHPRDRVGRNRAGWRFVVEVKSFDRFPVWK
jgi:hypothetical protein